MAEYEARPHCVVSRDWVRVALKTLREQLSTLNDDAQVTFGFDGRVDSRLSWKSLSYASRGFALARALLGYGERTEGLA